MGTKFALPYACLAMGYLEDTKLRPDLSTHFGFPFCDLITRMFLRYIDDGFLLWPSVLDIDVLIKIVNNLNHNISFTVQSGIIEVSEGDKQVEDFLDIHVILINHNVIETDIFYKETNSHFYLNYKSHHPDHIKNNIPYGLAKRIVIIVSNEKKAEQRLNEHTKWLTDCNYPLKIIQKGIHNAKL